MEELVNDKLLEDRNATGSDVASPSSTSTESSEVKRKLPRKSLDVSGPVKPYHPRLKNFWYPVAFSTDLKDDTMVSYIQKFFIIQCCSISTYSHSTLMSYYFSFQIPIDCFEEPWVLFRGKDGNPGCLQNTCAHRACPLHLGSVNEGRIQCPYHG